MTMNEDKLLKMVRDTDPKLAKNLEEVINGKIVKQIRCNSKRCKGKIIGYILNNGQPQEKMSKNSGLLGIRSRFDGYTGVQCLCGNDSRLSEHEKGIVGANTPSKKDLNDIWERVNKKPTVAKESRGKIEVDNFTIEEI